MAGTTAAGIYTALAPVNDKRDIRCYFHADLTTVHHLKPPQEGAMPPYVTAGIFDTDGSNATKDPKTGHLVTGMKQVSDPVNLCSRIWSEGMMNPDGITNDLIPADFVAPAPGDPHSRTRLRRPERQSARAGSAPAGDLRALHPTPQRMRRGQHRRRHPRRPRSLRPPRSPDAAEIARSEPGGPESVEPPAVHDPDELMDRAALHGDEHVIKLTDAVLDTYAATGDPLLLAAATACADRIEPPL
ncbi:hypothetical protein [Sinomonas humi]|uniref:hypothetical protein n=1 Tax=Sinomonas humi TaxID=1338436 RepID=UPI0012E07CA9|nr:hypothetical protein [Sinomonas humi]